MKRPIRIEGDVAYIPLTKGYEAIIDAADVPLVDGYSWYVMVRPHTIYVQRMTVKAEGGKKRPVLLHRQILNAADGMEVDHMDANGLNNRRSNIRLVTPSQNQWGQRRNRINKSGVKGVCWNRATGKWLATIGIAGKRKHIGQFFDIKDAAEAYALASKKIHGEYGRIDFVNGYKNATTQPPHGAKM